MSRLTNQVVESTLKRHGYYCRTRKGHSSGTRTRSCLACARAKARCDAESSSCSRCITKGLHCKYPGGTTSSSAALRPKPATAGPAQPDSPHEDVVPSSTIIEDDFPDAEDIDIDFDISDLNRGQLSWDLISTEVNSTPDLAFNQDQPLLNLVSTPITSQQSSSSSPQYSPISALSAMPLYHLRAFAQNPMTKSGPANTTSILMMRILTSYPTMLRDLSNLPPFIHPLFLAGQEKGGKSLESLTTCVSLIQMLNSGIQGSKKLVWKNVRLECERLQVQVCVHVSSHSTSIRKWRNGEAKDLLIHACPVDGARCMGPLIVHAGFTDVYAAEASRWRDGL